MIKGNSIGHRPREAKLVSLIDDENLNLTYKFKESSIDFKNPSGENGSKLMYITWDREKDISEIREKALETFDNNYSADLFVGKNHLWKNFAHSSIEEVEENLREYKKELEGLKLKDWYNPFSRNFWNKNNLSTKALTIFFEAGFLGLGIKDSIVEQSFYAGIDELIGATFIAGAVEAHRYFGKKKAKREIENLNENINDYKTFKKNLENANIEVLVPEEAKEIMKEVKKSKGSGEYNFLDIGKINSDLIKAYNKF